MEIAMDAPRQRQAGSRGPWTAQPSYSKRKWRRRGNGFRKKNERYQKKKMRLEQADLDQEHDPPRRLRELRWQKSRLKTRRNFLETRRRTSVPMTVPRAPFNDSSYLMRVRRPEGESVALASSSSSSPATTAALLTNPAYFSSCPAAFENREGMVEPVREIGVGNRYGSMTGLISLRAAPTTTTTDDRSSSNGTLDNERKDVPPSDAQTAASLGFRAESAQQVEQRLDRAIVSRFQMTYPSSPPHKHPQELLEQRAARQDSQIAALEDENLSLKERLFLLQQEVDDLRERIDHGQLLFCGDGLHQLAAADACSDHCSSD